MIPRDQFVLSYNDNTRQANWVGWSLSNADRGATDRTDAWSVETMLPSGYLRVGTAAFGTGWDRGHMAPSADRTLSYADNAATFVMSNIIPQASRNNQGLWGDFENYSRQTLAADGSEVVIISGPSEFGGSMLSNGMAIPASVWKIAVKVPAGNGTAAQRVTASSRVIALLTPNINSTTLGSWQGYITSVEEIESVTGFEFFRDIKALNPALATYLKNVVDTGTGPNSPTVITSFTPTSGAPGTPVTISGFNFGSAPQVRFNGVAATATVSGNGSQISTSVPSGATSGAITVVSTNGTDSSGAVFTVLTSNTPTLSLSTTQLAGLPATAGAPGLSKTYTLSGSNLSGAVTLNASAGFEMSRDTTLFSQTLSIPPVAGALVNVPIYVRIATSSTPGTLEGQIVHSTSGAQSVALGLAGQILSNLPTLTVSPSSLAGFSATQGSPSLEKTYTVSGYNLTGSVTAAAPTNFEISGDGTSYADSLVFVPSGSSLAATPVRVRLKASAPLGASSGNITHSGGGATANLQLYGEMFLAGSESITLVEWEMGGLSGGAANYGPSPFTANQTSSSVTTSGLMRGDGVQTSGSGAANAWGGNGFGNGTLADAIQAADFFSFSITSDSDTPLSLRSILPHRMRRSSTGPRFGQWQYQVGAGEFRDLGSTSTWTSNSSSGFAVGEIPLSGETDLQSLPRGTTVNFRLVAFGANSSGGNLYLMNGTTAGPDFVVTGAIGSTAPSNSPLINSPLIVSATAFSSFTYQITATNNPLSFSASGLPEGLSCDPATGVISGTPTIPGNYAATLTANNAAGDGTATLSITVGSNPLSPAISGSLSATGKLREPFDFQVEATNSPKAFLASGLPAGLSMNPSTGEITGSPELAGNFSVWLTVQNDYGSDSKTLLITIKNPVLAVSQSSLAGFSSSLGFAGTAQSYSLSGSQLTGDITVMAPPSYEVSAGGGVFLQSLVLTPASGSISANLSVRLSANATLGAHEETVIHSGGGAVPQYLPLSGNTTAPVPTLSLSTAALEPFSTTTNTPSNFQTYTVAGSGLTGDLNIQAPSGFELRPEGAGNFTNSVSISPSNGAIAQTSIEVRLASRSTGGTFAGSITHSAGGAGVKNISVNGTVIAVAPPVISTSGSGSAYRGRSHSLQIRLQGSTTANGYGATGLPSGLSVNTATGLISGTPTAKGNFTIVLSASGDGGTATANYTLQVRDTTDDVSIPLEAVVNKFLNDGTADLLEILVTARGTPGGTADLRGAVLKDFSSNVGADLGGKYIFSNSTTWQSLSAGTLIVLSSTNSTEDLDGSDFVIRANLLNPSLFTVASGGFDISSTDMVMLKPAGTGADGVAGGMHALSVGSAGSLFSNFNGRKLNASRDLTSNRPFGFALSPSRSLADFYSSSGADIARSLTFGTGNNANNNTFIQSLRTTANTPPVITLNGTSPMTIAHGTVYSEPGAVATDQQDGSRPVTISGVVNPMVVGTYIITYRASDTGNATATEDRIVHVTDQTPPVVTLNGNSTIEVPFGGPFNDPGATATDAVDGAVSVDISGTVNPFAAGEYQLLYSATDSAGNTSPNTMRTVVVAKGTPTITQAPSASPIVSGNSLATSTLSGGNASIAGAFAWTHPNTIPPLGTGNFSVTFTPADSGNYTTANTSAAVTVSALPSTFESWASSQGLAGGNASPTADPDADGWTNAQEFAFGLNPQTAGGRLVEIGQTIDGRVRITFLKRAGMNYTVRLATSLESGFTATLASTESADQSNTPADYTRHEAVLPEDEKAFIKIEAAP
ncbi:MAG: DNA/RNA non-specific endonuclease [Verrucomicrobia bacterium]|nr:DNA/RNA non-specific endonuclease [Verrucomicrobiota bacterium]